MAMSLVAHYPDKKKLVSSMIDLAVEELNHFRQVMRLLEDRNLIVTADEKDPYVNEMRTHVRKGQRNSHSIGFSQALSLKPEGKKDFDGSANPSRMKS